MAKSCIGIDIGAGSLKIAVCSNGVVERLATAEVPDNHIKDGRIISPEATSDFLKEVLKKEKISGRSCAILLPPSLAFTRTMVLPAMEHEHLEMNLPYEFRDFIVQEKDKYFYDYAVLDRIDNEDGTPMEFELIAATALKSTIEEYSLLCRRAGMKLKTAIPEELAYMNFIRAHEARTNAGNDCEYGIIDLGFTSTRLLIYKGVKHQATRVIDYGAQLIDIAIAEELNVDEHIARAHKHANNYNELMSESCQTIYSNIALEIMRAINFYRFNSPDSDLQNIYLCGGSSKIEPLVEQIKREIPIDVHSITDILPQIKGEQDDAMLCQLAIGVALQ